ncbi:Unannotated [Lentimonas sp. CC19]|nr:Unannotated [Lentimonas sp. CC4]CAA6683743.1 Unannotated [Lentimonas sp. CC6]CAA6690183.1 Unannotated [Lentimonas sp. CC10]CAA6695981.1 Unannotated [Lentimonas sp. CC19]CAA7070222.1 Unannotated [Lentimonas sp. CC11]CAA7169019.1 Unannotated [Lentimonas sp. CC21]CAA7180574.1 Unannotated [Lentimonas sp. CC8]
MNKYITEHAKISIAICTRERPVMLTNLLNSMRHLALLEGVEVIIDIIENHTEENLKELISRLAPSLPFKVNYHWEPKLGIPIARNHALRVAEGSSATHIIFLDDDERVDSQWLKELWAAYLKLDQSSIIQGAVISAPETETNKHLHPFFQRKIRQTGDKMETCSTNNVIIPIESLTQHNLTFDESRPFAGGEDYILTQKAHRLNIPMRFCAESFVYEDIPDERLNLKWLSKRNFSSGLTDGEQKRELGFKLTYALQRLWKLLLNVFKAATNKLRSKDHESIKKWLKACVNAGQLLGYFRFSLNSYKTTDGN